MGGPSWAGRSHLREAASIFFNRHVRAAVGVGADVTAEPARALPWTRWGRRPQTPISAARLFLNFPGEAAK